MEYTVTTVVDMPYAVYKKKDVMLTADSPGELITEKIPALAGRMLEEVRESEWKRTGWKHVNMKFRLLGLEMEFVFDQGREPVAAVYLSDPASAEVISCSEEGLTYRDENDLPALKAETAKRAAEAKAKGLW